MRGLLLREEGRRGKCKGREGEEGKGGRDGWKGREGVALSEQGWFCFLVNKQVGNSSRHNSTHCTSLSLFIGRFWIQKYNIFYPSYWHCFFNYLYFLVFSSDFGSTWAVDYCLVVGAGKIGWLLQDIAMYFCCSCELCPLLVYICYYVRHNALCYWYTTQFILVVANGPAHCVWCTASFSVYFAVILDTGRTYWIVV